MLDVSVFKKLPPSSAKGGVVQKRAKATSDGKAERLGTCDMDDASDEPVLAFTMDIKVAELPASAEMGTQCRVIICVGMGADRKGFWTLCDALKGDVSRTNRRWRRKLAQSDESFKGPSAS